MSILQQTYPKMVLDNKNFSNYSTFKLLYSRLINMNHEDDIKSKLKLWRELGPKRKFQRNSILMVINEHLRHLLTRKFPVKSDAELDEFLIEITNTLISSLVELNARDKVTHNDLKGLKTLFSFTRTLNAFILDNSVFNGLFESITNEVNKISEKFKQVLTYWNTRLLAVEFNQNLKSNHIVKEDDNKNKEVNGKDDNGSKVKKGEKDS